MLKYETKQDQMLLKLVNELKKRRKQLQPDVNFKHVLDIEHDLLLEDNVIRKVFQGKSQTASNDEILMCNDYSNGASVVVLDNLNKHSIMMHVDPDYNRLSGMQYIDLFKFPKGILNVGIIFNSQSQDIYDSIKTHIEYTRKDIINFLKIHIPSAEKGFQVSYDPKRDNLYIRLKDPKKDVRLNCLDLKLFEYIPSLKDFAMKYSQ